MGEPEARGPQEHERAGRPPSEYDLQSGLGRPCGQSVASATTAYRSTRIALSWVVTAPCPVHPKQARPRMPPYAGGGGSLPNWPPPGDLYPLLGLVVTGTASTRSCGSMP